MVKTDPKKFPSPKFFFARSSKFKCPTFYEKKIPTSLALLNAALTLLTAALALLNAALTLLTAALAL